MDAAGPRDEIGFLGISRQQTKVSGPQTENAYRWMQKGDRKEAEREVRKERETQGKTLENHRGGAKR